MFTVHLTPAQTCNAAPGYRKDRTSCSLQSTGTQPRSLRPSRPAHELRQNTTPSSSSLSAGHSSLVSRLQSSMFFGGFGALSHDIEALHKGFSVEESTVSAPVPAPVRVTVAATAGIPLDAQAMDEGATHTAEAPCLEAHPPSGSAPAMVIVPWLVSSHQASGAVTAEGPLKQYRVTIEEISRRDGEKEGEDGGVIAVPTVSTTTTTTTTQSVMLPAGMMETLLRSVAAVGGAGDAAFTNANAGQVPTEVQVELKGLELQQQQLQHQQQQQQQQKQEVPKQHEECERPGNPEPTTQVLNPARPGPTAVSVTTQGTVMDAAADTTTSMQFDPLEVRNDAASSVPVLVSRAKELSPSSMSSATTSKRDSNLLETANGDEPIQATTHKGTIGVNQSVVKDHEPERDLRPWWQRRRDTQSAPHQRSTEDEHLDRGKGSNSSNGADNSDGDSETVDRFRRRQWPPRRHALRNGETVTQSTVIGPDGTVKSRTVMVTTTRAAQNAEMGHTMTNVHIQQQQQQESAAQHDQLQASTSSSRLLSTELQPQEPQQEQQEQQHRSKLRERWAQRRHHHQTHQDPWIQIEVSDEKDGRQLLWERRRQQRERLRELREAEALQREATAAAYGFNIHHQTLDNEGSGAGGGKVQETASSRSVWMGSNQHGENDQEHRPRRGWRVRERNTGAAAMVEEEEEEGRIASGSRRAWPPKGYLRRQEQERDEPRHNV
ncbi:hypothetical protein BGZ68_010532 [Mortierella alpina]|nr:hypothetical protein BGZ68_010532 [Mortierella alpina]